MLILPQGKQKVKHFRMFLTINQVFPLQTTNLPCCFKPANTVLEGLNKTVYVIILLLSALGRS